MDDFVKFAFYGKVPDDLEMNAIYAAYKIYCELFKIEELTKFDFIQRFNNYRYK